MYTHLTWSSLHNHTIFCVKNLVEIQMLSGETATLRRFNILYVINIYFVTFIFPWVFCQIFWTENYFGPTIVMLPLQ